MPIAVNEADTWDNIAPVLLNKEDVWTPVTGVFENIGGTWQQVYTSRPNVGDAYKGGFYFGSMTYADGNVYDLIDAGAAGNEGSYAFVSSAAFNPTNASDLRDGAANTAAALADPNGAHFTAVHAAIVYQGGGFTDWYLPSYYEEEMRQRNLKPGNGANVVNANAVQNPFSVPAGPTWTSSIPAETVVPSYQTGGANAFSIATGGFYWTSSWLDKAASTGYCCLPLNSTFGQVGMTVGGLVRPIRKVLRS